MDVNRITRRVALLVAVALLGSAVVRAADEPVKLTPEQFDKEVRKNAKKANETYKGKTIELTGKVLRVVRHFSGKPLLDLQANPTNEASGVLCFTSEKQPWGKFAKGQTVKVTGKFPDFATVPQLDDCTVEAVTESNIRAVTAEDLARECEADPAAAGKKMKGQTLKVTGTVTASEFDAKTNSPDVTLKGTDKTRVVCRLVPAEKESAAALKVGQTVTVVGQYAFTFEGKVNVEGADVLTEEK